MKIYIATLPIIAVLGFTLTLLATGSDANVLLGWAFMGACVICLLCVPVLSRSSLVLGYTALLVSLGAFVVLTFTTKPDVTVTVTDESEVKWDRSPNITGESVSAEKDESSLRRE